MSSKLLTGFVAGIVVGILIAPDKGSETRKKIAQTGRDVKDKFNEYVDEISDKIDSLKDDASKLVNRGKEKVQSMANETENPWSNPM